MPASDKQLTSSVKKVTSRELPNKGANIVNMSQGTSPLPKDKSHATDPGKAVGTKRSDAPASPGYHNVYVRRKVENDHSKVNSSQELKGNGRDKTKEQETQQNVQHDQINKPELASPIAESGVKMSPKSPDKTNEQIVTEKNEPHVASGSTAQDDTHKSSNQVPAQDNTHKSSNQVPAQDDTHKSSNQVPAQDDTHKSSNHVPAQDDTHKSSNQVPAQDDTRKSSDQVPAQDDTRKSSDQVPAQDDTHKSSNQMPAQDDSNKSTNQMPAQDDTHKSSNQVPAQDDTHKSSNLYWNARFNRLQTYLENCDRSTQEGYMRMLRSLSAADRSMHAIDLEKRAIHLLVEEGKELRRMKALNVLGKVSPNGSSKQPPL